MSPEQEESHQCLGDFAHRDIAWRRAAKAYTLLHALTALCMFMAATGAAGYPVGLVAMVGLVPFVVSSPILSILMICGLSHRHREWLYLGLCNAAILSLLLFATLVGSL
jgi:hypothetical protein